jgi:hypothetical protein
MQQPIWYSLICITEDAPSILKKLEMKIRDKIKIRKEAVTDAIMVLILVTAIMLLAFII